MRASNAIKYGLHINKALVLGSRERVEGQTAEIPNLLTRPVGPIDQSFMISGNVTVTAAGGAFDGIFMQCQYTDESNTPRSLNLVTTQGAGAFAGQITQIRAKANTDIVFAMALLSGVITYNAEPMVILLFPEGE